MEPPAGGGLDQVEDVLPVPEAVEGGGDGPDLEGHLAQEQDEGGDPGQLGQDRADVLGPGRGFDAHEQLGAVDERHLVGEARQPVDPVDQRGDLGVRPVLGELLVAPVHVADDRVSRHHPLPVELDHHPEGAVGGGVLGPEVEDHALGLELDVDAGVGQVLLDQRLGAEVEGHSGMTSWTTSSPGIGSTSTRPGQGLTSLASSGKSLRRGWPSNSAGR